MTILVTGGCGFIGSNFISYFNKANPSEKVITVDALTYAGNIKNLDNLQTKFYCCNIVDENIHRILEKEKPDTIYHFAAESHVDNSIKDSSPFIQTNVFGTVNLLEAVRKVNSKIRFVHISTDEVYGSLDIDDDAFNLSTPYNPRSPYSASKAASDHFVMAYHHTYGLDTVITNCSNNYGPLQHPEKLIPTIISRVQAGKRVPIYGSGMNIRDWLYVDDHCRGIHLAGERGISGKKYLFGGENQMCNLELAKWIIELMGQSIDLIEFVEDRKGHDFRYDIDTSESRKVLGWKPEVDLENGLKATIEWYNNNVEWINSCQRKR